MSSAFRRSPLSRRRLAGGLIGAAALSLVAISPVAKVGAEDVGGTITFGARFCDTWTPDPLTCPSIDPGALTLVHEDGVELLTMDESVMDGDNLVWGVTSSVQTGNYFFGAEYLNVPAGYELFDMYAPYGNAGGSEFGWYIGTTAEQPDNALYAVFMPIQTDSDGDGAPDTDEIAFGSDPYDASDFPYVQAGPEPGDGSDTDVSGAEAETEPAQSIQSGGQLLITTLPNTGAGGASNDSPDFSLIALLGGGVLALAGAAVSLRRRKA